MRGAAPTEPFLPAGTFTAGCNYWASHAGTAMWRRWNADTVDSDLSLLSSRGLVLVRVFPLWPDFQPIVALRGGRGRIRGYGSAASGCAEVKPLGPGADGLDPVMLRRLTELADVAHQYGLRVIVSLVTGWMSGRLFIPPALENLDPIADPAAILWEIRLVRGIVRHLGGHAAVAAWELGNECNVMGAGTSSQSWLWTAAIADAIRSEDPTLPVVSGMHGLATEPGAAWSMAAQGENVDLLTTHPYPLFTPHCDRESLPAMRPTLHAAAESCLYADLGGKPAFAEELGSLGPMVSGEEEMAAYARAAAFSLWAHDCRALLWWCAFDFEHLDHVPYEWEPIERELGLFRGDGAAKPAVGALEHVRDAVSRTGIGALPPRSVQAVCVLPAWGEWWGVAFSAFILSLQAGFDVRFVVDGAVLPDAPLYVLPCLSLRAPLSRTAWRTILHRVERGADLYVSLHDGVVTEFEATFGVRVRGRGQRAPGGEGRLLGGASEVRWSLPGGTAFHLHAVTAEVMGVDEDGEPLFTRSPLGKGRVFLLAFPLEAQAAELPGAFDHGDPRAPWRIYEEASSRARAGRVVGKASPFVGVTEHPEPDAGLLAVLVNYGAKERVETLTLRPGWAVSDVLYGHGSEAPDGGVEVRIPGCDAVVLRARRVERP